MEEWNYSKHYKDRLKQIQDQKPEKGQVILLGDCMIEDFNNQKYFPNLTIYNHGIKGDTTKDLIDSLFRRAIKYKPKKLFLSIGSNDIPDKSISVKQIYNNIISIVKEVQMRSKETEIYIVSIVPVNTANKEFINQEKVLSIDNYDVNLLNYYLNNYTKKNRLKFVNITKELKNNLNQLNIEYTIDGFHLNDKGYKIVSEVMKSYV